MGNSEMMREIEWESYSRLKRSLMCDIASFAISTK